VPRKTTGAASISPNRAIALEDFVRIYQLVYYSTSLVAPLDGGGRKDIENILGAAKSLNGKLHVTGALTFNEFYFAQVLEGPYEAVKTVFGGILRDRRHTNVTVLQEGWVEARDFSQWAMAYVGDETSLNVISGNLQLKDILSEPRAGAAMALIEMMRFWLLGHP